MMRAIRAELLKLKGARVLLWSSLAVVGYGLIAIAGSFVMENPKTLQFMLDQGGVFEAAARLGRYAPTWENALRQNVQGLAGAWGIFLFGFVTAYVFGRERKEGTSATVLTAPVPRWQIAVAKLVVVALWILGLTLFSFAFQTAGMALSGPSDFSVGLLTGSLGDMLKGALLLYLAMPLVAFMSLLGKPGYLKPMVLAVLLNGDAMSWASRDKANLVPWAMPILIQGASWMPIVSAKIDATSWAIAFGVFVVGTALTVWKFGQSSDAL